MVCPYAIDRPGGVQDQAASLVGWLQEEGHDAWLVAPGTAGGPPGTVLLGPTIRVRTNRSVAPIRLAPRTRAAVAAAVAGADVVHIHEPLVPAVSTAALGIGGIPKVGTFHADPGSAVRVLYRLGRRGLRRLIRPLAVSVAVSPVAAGAIRPIVGEPTLIPNTIDIDAFRSPAARVPDRIAFLGRDEPRKGLDVLLEAFTAVRATRPRAELVVMGADRDPRPGVHFMGPVDHATKAEQLSSSAILVTPNTGGESFGLVVLEGLAAGCAVVASSLPAFQYVAGDAALFVPPGDPAAVARALESLLGDAGLMTEYQERARRRAGTFDRHRVVAEYLKVYARAVDKTGE